MILADLVDGEQDPRYKALEVANGNRQYNFLASIIAASLAVGRPFLSSNVIKALNYHAIACLHVNAGEYRPASVRVGTPPDHYDPPEHWRVHGLMDDMVNVVNRGWDNNDGVGLATFVLWRMNMIHPFMNGSGRTARAACYLVLCLKAGKLLPGTVILPELIRRERPRYLAALKHADKSLPNPDLGPLHALLKELVNEQLASAAAAPAAPAAPAGP
jgi:Fic family protein